MSDTIIRVENLGKKYIIGHQQEGRSQYDTFRDVIANGAKSLFKRFSQPSPEKPNKEEFWALKDVSFEIKQGECVGIIGRNGAGKSTLLKILSRITEPTTGRISIKGRVASLLEVGTGFHPELTGRENIYLNGAILGMSRAEIKKKFDEIVAFAEVEKFLDTPVKRYSSGMYVRLAFAVAAHLEPEILVVDEVLAVGDFQFQQKCIGKMQEVGQLGRTVLYVSHNTATIRAFCNKLILLKKGKVALEGVPEKVLEEYFKDDEISDSIVIWNKEDAPQTPEIRFIKAYIINEQKELATTIECSQKFSIVLEYETFKAISGLRIGFIMQNSEGIIVCGSNTMTFNNTIQPPGTYTTKCDFQEYTLNSGKYSILFGADCLPNFTRIVTTPYCIAFDVNDTLGHGFLKEKLPGILRPKLLWNTSHFFI